MLLTLLPWSPSTPCWEPWDIYPGNLCDLGWCIGDTIKCCCHHSSLFFVRTILWLTIVCLHGWVCLDLGLKSFNNDPPLPLFTAIILLLYLLYFLLPFCTCLTALWVRFLSRWYSVCATGLSTALFFHLIHVSCVSTANCRTSSVTQSASSLLDTGGSECWAYSTVALSFSTCILHSLLQLLAPILLQELVGWCSCTSLLCNPVNLVWCFGLSCVSI